MEALSVLMPLMQMGMSGAQSTMNTGLGLIPTAISLVDRWRARTDPLMRRFSQIIGGRYNQAVGENPYGDPYGAWGGMFGQNDAGGNIGVGEAQARAINQMMQNNPAESAISNYQTLAAQQRPGVVDSTSGLASLMGHESQFSQPYQSPMFSPEAPDMSAALNTDFSGSPAPRDTSDQQVNSNLFGRGGVGSNAVDILSGLDSNGLNNLLSIGGALANRGGGGGGGGLFGGGGFPGWTMVGAQPIRTGGGAMGGGGGGLPFDPSMGRRPGGKRNDDYFLGTPFVKRTGQRVGRGEAVIPAPLNPANQGGQPAPGITPGQPMMGLSGSPTEIQPMANPMGAAQSPPNTMMQLLENPMSLSPEVQDMIINRGLEGINNERAAYDRRLQEQAAGMGRGTATGTFAGQMGDLNQFAWEQGNNLRRDVPIEAARTNTADLRAAAGLQLQGEQALANQQMQQNQFQQGLFNQDFQNQGRIIDATNALGNQGMQNQMGWWNMLTGLANQGINFANPFLQSAIQNQMWRIQPSQIAQAPIQVSGGTTAMPVGYGGGYGGGGGGGVNYAPLAGALSYWAGSM